MGSPPRYTAYPLQKLGARGQRATEKLIILRMRSQNQKRTDPVQSLVSGEQTGSTQAAARRLPWGFPVTSCLPRGLPTSWSDRQVLCSYTCWPFTHPPHTHWVHPSQGAPGSRRHWWGPGRVQREVEGSSPRQGGWCPWGTHCTWAHTRMHTLTQSHDAGKRQ